VTCDDDQVATSADGVEDIAVVGNGCEEALPGIAAGWPELSMSCRVMASLNRTAIAARSVL
jgi:hypothetical protein